MVPSEVKYQRPSNLNVANFVSTKLSFLPTSTNYEAWKEQMLCLIEGQDMLGFIDGTILPPPETSSNEYLLWRRSDKLLKGLILGSLDEDIVRKAAARPTSRDVWLYLEKKFHRFSNKFELHSPDPDAPGSSEQNRQEGDMIEYLPLYKAALKGDWETAKAIFESDPGSKSVPLNSMRSTALHVAIQSGKRSILLVKEMMKMMMMMTPASEEFIIAQDKYGDTALHVAASVGNTEAAIILADTAPRLLYIQSFRSKDFPIERAAVCAQRKTLEYLISVTKEQSPYTGMHGLRLLICTIDAEFFDVALMLVHKYPYLAKLRLHHGECALSVMAQNKSAFGDGEPGRFSFWERFISFGTGGVTSTVQKKKKMNQQAWDLVKLLCKKLESMRFKEADHIACPSILIAAELGVGDVVEMIVDALPNVIYACQPDSGRSIFHLAVLNRSEDVFNLIYQMSELKYSFSERPDKDGNNLLHAAGKLGPSHKLNQISGAALQMQRELQWYKEVEKFIVSPITRKRLNKEGKSPKMVFTEEHKNLKEAGEKWMKDTAGSCTIAASLIVTIMFAAAITVPGGNDNSSGFPIFSKDKVFLVFAIADAISLFASTTSLLMFLSILTSRYAEEDFLRNLPKRLIVGLGTLFLSITFMMVAFCATVYLVFGQNKAWLLIPVGVLACLPITSFVLLQYPLLADLISSTFGPGIFGKRSDRPFY